MFKLSRRQNTLRASLLGLIIVAVLSTAAYFIINQHQNINATKTGDSVQITKKFNDDLNYGDHQTHWYEVTNLSSNRTYTSYCAEPKKDNPVGTKTATSLSGGKYDQIKLMIYIREKTDDADITDLRNSIFSSIKNDSDWGTSETYRIYAFTHAVIGATYGGDWEGLDSGMKAQVRSARDLVEAEINHSGVAWQHAQQYALFYANKSSTDGDQDVVWIEPYGKIIVRKCDAEITSECIPQGNANFNGITFTLYNGSTEIASKTLTNGAQSVTFDHLNIDATYTIKESGSNSFYNLTASDQTNIAPTPAGTTVTFKNQIKHGKLTVQKVDKETNSCTNTTNGLSLAGTRFNLINSSINSIVYGEHTITPGSIVTSKTLAEGECQFDINNLPYGQYSLVETEAATGYAKDSTPRAITISSSNNGSATYKFENQPIRGDLKFVKTDPTNGIAKSNMVFSISAIDDNQNIKETHIVVSNQNGEVDTSAISHTFHTNGYDELYDSIEDPLVYLGYGTWFGKDKNGNSIQARNDVGALPYGTYIVQELRCDANMFCTNIINQKKTIKITQHNQVLDLENWDNDCAEFSIETEATDNKDGDKIIEVTDEPIEIKDTVSYCAKKNYSFVIKGILMDKETGNPVKVNGKNVEQSIEVKPETDCGTVEMIYKLDAKDLAGKEVVVFESLYYRDSLMTSHEEIDDENQTVELISLTTYATNEDTGDKILPLDSDVRIKDTVKYCLKPGVEYTVKGVIMDKKTGNGLLINSEPIEQIATFTPQTACGEFDMFYDLNTTNLGGAELVIFESLYRDDKLLLEHRDIHNAAETVTVELPAPETGALTKNPNASQESSNLSTIIIIVTSSIVIYTAIRFTTKKRFLKR